MVTVSKVEETRERLAGSGFVVHCSEEFTVVAVHPSFDFQGLDHGRMIEAPKATVKFYDGAKTSNTTFIKLSRFVNLIVARIARGGCKDGNG
jgi:hypothetical protein